MDPGNFQAIQFGVPLSSEPSNLSKNRASPSRWHSLTTCSGPQEFNPKRVPLYNPDISAHTLLLRGRAVLCRFRPEQPERPATPTFSALFILQGTTILMHVPTKKTREEDAKLIATA